MIEDSDTINEDSLTFFAKGGSNSKQTSVLNQEEFRNKIDTYDKEQFNGSILFKMNSGIITYHININTETKGFHTIINIYISLKIMATAPT